MGVIFDICYPKENKFPYLIGEKIDGFKVTSLDGRKTINLKDLKGKKVVLNFTTTWCPKCIKEKEILELEYIKKYKDSNIEFIVLFGPYRGDTKEVVENYLKENKYTFPSYYDKVGEGLFNQFKITTVPTTILIDEGGTLEDFNVGSDYKNMKFFKDDLL